MRTRPASLMPDEQTAKAPPQPRAAPAKAAEPMRWYRVTGGPGNSKNPGEVGPFRREQGDYFLKIGNEINSGQYDIRTLKNQGVKLDEIEPPGWYVDQQERGKEKAEELRADGVDVGPGADYEPTPLADPAPARQ